MPEINLYRPQEQPPKTDTQEFLDAHFDLSFSPEEIESLKDAQNETEIQNILNNVFTEERRKSMLEHASEDTSGRKVKYYRIITWDRFLELLEWGIQDTLNPDKEVDEDDEINLKSFILEYLRDKYKMLDNPKNKKYEEMYNMSLREILMFGFPETSEAEIQKFLDNPTRANIKIFMEARMDNKEKKRAHTGGLYMKFLNYMSASVGGVITYRPQNTTTNKPNFVYLEMTIPDDKIIIQPDSGEGEKEILVREIKLSNVARACLRDDVYEKLILGEDSNIREYALKNKLETQQQLDIQNFPAVRDYINEWRWHSSINDYLPKSLAHRKASQNFKNK